MTVLLDKWAIYKHPLVNWKPHNGQLIVAQSSARHQVLSAGRRFGKSVCGGYRLLPEIFFTKPIANQLVMDGKKRIFWIVGPAYEDSEKEFRVIWNLCKRLEIPMDQPGSYNNPENGAMRISLFGGAMLIIAKSAQNPERLVGEGLSGVILSEAAKLKESVWIKYLRPTLADFGGWSFWSSTPESKNHFYHAWRRGQDPNNSEWESWRMPAWINQYVYTETGRMMARTGKYGLTIPKEEFTDSSQVMRLLALQEYSSDSIHKLAKDHRITGVDLEVLDSLEELTPEAFKQEIAADFCVDEETEILTQRGWLRYIQVQAGDRTLGMRAEDGTAEWVEIQDVNVFPERHRKMVRMSQRAHDSLTTKDHRWLVERVDLNHSCMFKERKFTVSENLGKTNERIVCASPVTNLPREPKYTDALVELVAWYWTEGYRRDGRSIQIAQSFDANPVNSSNIRQALQTEFGDPYEGRRAISGNGWRRSSRLDEFYIGGDFAEAIYQHAQGKNKELSYDFVTSLTKAQLKLFIDTSISGDGWLKHNPQSQWGRTHGAEIAQKLRHNLDVLQFACQLYGLRTNLTYRPRVNQWWLRIFEKNSFYPVSAKRSGGLSEVDYFGKVWCPTTPTHTWLARRDGTVYFTGNTTMVGRVFKEFDEETHVTDLAFNPKWETYAAVDYGVTNPNVWLLIQVSPWGEINVLDEVYEEGLDSEEFADEIRRRQLNPFNLRYFYPDPAGPGDSKILSRKLGITPRGGTGGEINTRITLIRKALRVPRITTDDDVTFEAGGTRPQLLFDRKCVRTIADMLAYRYPEKKKEAETSTKRYDNPLKKDDHGPEALGRFFIGHFGSNQGGMKIHQAEFGSKNQRQHEDRKPDRYMRPVSDEQRRVDFPVINDALGNYLAGSYDR